MNPRTVQQYLTLFVMCIAVSAWAGRTPRLAPTDAFSSEVAVAWFDLLYEVVKIEHLAPPSAARIYGVAAVAVYEAVVGGSREHASLVGQLNALASAPQPQPHLRYHWPTVANSALAKAVRGLFPGASQASLEAIDALEQQFGEAFQSRVRQLVFARSVAFGQAVAEAILAWAASDGYATFDDCPYTPPVGPGLWEATPPAYAPDPLQPCWGLLRPFVLTSGADCAPPPHPPYSEAPTSEFYAHALTVYQTRQTLTDEQKIVAQYWADSPGATGTPSGHWIAIVGQIARQDGLSLMAAAEAYARVGIAVADAFISCWYTKFTYNLLRPVTYLQKFVDASWLPFLSTPPFPEYASGHSTQSGAASVVLTDMFGVRAFTDTTHADHDLQPALEPRTFHSFEEAAQEAALSRLYGGIHYPFGNDNGLVQGRCIGQEILDLVQFRRSGMPMGKTP